MEGAELLEAGGGLRVRVTGLRQAVRQLERAGVAATELKDAMQRVGSVVAHAAAPRAPRRTGKLAASVRPGRGKTKAVIRAGGARVPYAGVVHYGWPARGIRPRPFLTDALSASRATVTVRLEAEITTLLERHNLK